MQLGLQGCQLVELAQTWLCLHWGSHLVLAASTPAIFGRRGETLEATGGQEDEGGEAFG